MLKFKKNILNLKRIQTSTNRDLSKGVNLDRNERVDIFDYKTKKKINKSFSKAIYNSTPDITSLYEKLAKFHKINKNNIYITQGITECISHLIFSLVNKNEEVITLNPTYPMYEIIFKLNNTRYKTWNFNNKFELNLDDLKKKITKKTKILFLINPNLPIEYEFSEKLKREIYSICKKKNIILVYDEAYYHFGSNSEINNALRHKNTIVMRTFSKAWGLPGIRLGYMITNKKLNAYVSKCRSLVETNGFSYEIAKWALKNKNILNDNVRSIKNGYKYLVSELKKHDIEYFGGKTTNSILVKLQSKKLCDNLIFFLKKKKIYIRGGFQEPLENYVRISLGSSEILKRFLKEFLNWKKQN